MSRMRHDSARTAKEAGYEEPSLLAVGIVETRRQMAVNSENTMKISKTDERTSWLTQTASKPTSDPANQQEIS